MPKGTIKVTAVLHNPDGVWEQEIPVEYPAGAEKQILMQVLGGVRTVGLLTTIGPEEVELIPETRVKHYNFKLNTVVLGNEADVASAATSAAATNAIANVARTPGKIIL